MLQSPKSVILLGDDAKIDATTKRHGYLFPKCLSGQDVVLGTDLLDDLLLGETVWRLLAPQQIVDEDRLPYHLDLLVLAFVNGSTGRQNSPEGNIGNRTRISQANIVLRKLVPYHAIISETFVVSLDIRVCVHLVWIVFVSLSILLIFDKL